jgi:FlaA1/EpsC-like NDP-sugar epimerase
LRRARQKFALDLLLWTAAGILAFGLRAPRDAVHLLPKMLVYTALTIPVSFALLLRFRLFSQVYKEVSLGDVERVVRAVGIGTAADFAVGLVIFAASDGFPRTVPLIQGLLASGVLIGVRLLTRLRAERLPGTEAGRQTRVLLVGAGNAGAGMAREINSHRATGIQAVGFLDDAPSKRRVTVAGVPVLGAIDDLPRVVREERAAEVLLTVPSARGGLTNRVVTLTREVGVPLKVLPGLEELLNGEVDLSRLRPVQVADLLRRDPVKFNEASTSGYVRGRVVMVTGAGGSIGSELVRQSAGLGAARLVLFGHGENTLWDIQRELHSLFPRLEFVVALGDIRDSVKVAETMSCYRPDVVFHAAAHKHVPFMEGDPDEAVLNNVGGTRNVVEAALAHGVRRFVNISTDKAVHPTSVLGLTKSLAERVVRKAGARAEDGQIFVSVRFGNVLGSRGSVVPLFEEQIRRGGPVTLTDPRVTRYFMTISEASRLVIQAGALGVNGAVYVLDMGTPMMIVDLAKEMIRLAGADENDVEIVFTGLRPGEKLHEELLTEEEQVRATTFEHIIMAQQQPLADEDAGISIDSLIAAAQRRDWHEMDRCMKILAPDFAAGGSFGDIRPPASITIRDR